MSTSTTAGAPTLSKQSRISTKQLAILGILTAIAYVLMYVSRLFPPIFLWLKYDPKDIVIVIAGFIYGPLSSLVVSVVVSFLEMITISETGIIGLAMNVLSTAFFACTASMIYRKNRSITGAVIGLVLGALFTTGIMLLWNYLIVPLYMPETTREMVKPMLVSVFLPFNLLKGGLNAALTIFLYKPVVTGLRKARLLPESASSGASRGSRTGVLVFGFALLATCILLLLLFKGII